MKYKFLLFTLTLFITSFVGAQSIGIVGPAADGWPDPNNNPAPDIMLTDNGDGTHSIDALQLSDGEAKFRTGQDWSNDDYGGTSFPTGNVLVNDPNANIPVTAGTYDITLDLNNDTYNFDLVTTASDTALITGYIDSTCSGADGRTVEVYVDGTVDFSSGWTLERQANGGGFTSSIDISGFGSITDDFVYITNDQATLDAEFSINTNVIENGNISSNGDDAFQLSDDTGSVVDRLGEDGVDGTGTAWEHENTYVYRNDSSAPNAGAFDASNWTVGALGLLDNEGTCNGGNPFSDTVPFGSFSASVAPTCVKPENFAASNIMINSVDLAWDEEDPSSATDGYEWVVMASGDAPDTANAVETGTVNNGMFMATVNNLDAETNYDAYVRSICDAANSEVSDWSAVASFSTLFQGASCDLALTSATVTPYGDNSQPINIDTAGLPDMPTVPSCEGTDSTEQGLWYEITTNNSNGFALNIVSGDGGDLEGAIYDACGGTELICFADGGSVDLSSEILVTGLNQNTTYFLQLFTESFNEGVYELAVTDLPSCPAPQNLNVTNISTDSASINFDEETSASDGYEYVLFTDGTVPDDTTTPDGNVSDGTTTSIPLTNLNAETDYDAYVRSVCDATATPPEVSDWSAVASFSTLFQGASCDLALTSATVTPYGDNSQPINIDTAGLPDMPTVPSCEGFDSTEQGLWYEITTNNSNGFALNIVSGDGEDLEGAIYDACGGTELICFADGGSVDLSSEILVTGLNQNTTYFLQLFTESFNEGVYELAVTDLPSCPAPQNLNVTNITSDSASLNFDEETSASDGYEYVLFTDGTVPDDTTTPDGNVSDGTTTSISLTNLNAATEYDAYVRSVCDATATPAEVSDWSSVVTFTTACDVFVPDYSEDFADMTFSEAPDCWDEADAGDPTTGPSGLGSGDWGSDDFLNDISNSNSARINLWNTGTSSWLLSPEFDLSAGGYEVVFDVGITEFTGSDDSAMGSDDEVQFLYSDDGGTTWNNLETWAQGSEPSNSGELKSYDLSGTTGTSVQFAFWATEGTVDDTEDYNVYVDNFKVRTPPTCPEPLNLTASNITDTSADLNWDEEDPSSATDGYEWVVMASGDAPDTANAVETGTVNNGMFMANVGNLTAETDYDAYVRSVCDATATPAEVSNWSNAESFSTGIAPTVVSVGSPASETYCYSVSELKEWRFDSDDGSPLTVIFSAGSVEENTFSGGTYDDLIIYDGTDDTGAVLFDSDNDGNELGGLSFTAASGSIYMTLDSDSLNSCQDTASIETIEFDVYIQGDEPTASVQIIHNSADPNAEFVDIYLDDVLIADDFEFRTASAFLEVPAETPINIDVAPQNSSDISDSVFNLNTTLTADETYIAVANGVLDPSNFEGAAGTIGFGIDVFAGAQQSSTNAGETSILVHHGATDAPTVDVVNFDNDNILVDDISYTEFDGYLDLPTQDYIINIEAADNSSVVGTYAANLQSNGLADAAITVVASGFLTPANDQNGPAFGLWAALPAGGPLVELTETVGTDAFTDYNFNYYPNPVEQRLNISSNGIVEDVQIFNMLGQEVIHVEPNKENPQINMSGLQSGTYMMKVSIEGASQSFSVIKK